MVDLGYGDAGKGVTIARLAAHTPRTAIVRFNGGGQAQHNVITDTGTHHVFAQIGAGTLTSPTIPTHLTEHHLLDLPALHAEANHLLHEVGVPNPLRNLTISPRARIVTHYMIHANRERERQRQGDKHGSTGRGIGETVAYSITHPDTTIHAADIENATRNPHGYNQLVAKLEHQHAWYLAEFPATRTDFSASHPTPQQLADYYTHLGTPLTYRDDLERLHELNHTTDRILFEGAQGILLDENYGFHPHTTWSTTLPTNAINLINAAHIGPYEIGGVTRTYHTRHGAGPFPTELPAKHPTTPPEPHNDWGPWAGHFRRGYLDLAALRYAQAVLPEPLTWLSVTHADINLPHADYPHNPYRIINPANKTEREHQTRTLTTETPHQYTIVTENGKPAPTTPHLIAEHLNTPLKMVGYGPTIGDHTHTGKTL